ncbi:hypothetical protein DS893_00310 [Vibrionales bacterium C3R12]|nr:hypothetical protein DS893_00310 [Vibrionales bacterium C3R12]
MKKISGATFIYKKLFPTLVIGFLSIWIAVYAISGGIELKNTFVLLLFVGVVIFTFVFFRKTVWDLVDEVFDCGDCLIYRLDGIETKVMLDEITHIACAHAHSPERAKVFACTREGKTFHFVFCLKARIILSRRDQNPVILELVERIDQVKIT